MSEYAAQPGFLPARMLNEFVYCPRLFYFEWVDQRRESNDDMTEGRIAHRPVDSRGGRMPEEGGESGPRTTYSVALSDEEWGLSAVIDRVDHREGVRVRSITRRGTHRSMGNRGLQIALRCSPTRHCSTQPGTPSIMPNSSTPKIM